MFSPAAGSLRSSRPSRHRRSGSTLAPVWSHRAYRTKNLQAIQEQELLRWKDTHAAFVSNHLFPNRTTVHTTVLHYGCTFKQWIHILAGYIEGKKKKKKRKGKRRKNPEPKHLPAGTDGGVQRRVPVGGFANGMLRNPRTWPCAIPLTEPWSVYRGGGGNRSVCASVRHTHAHTHTHARAHTHIDTQPRARSTHTHNRAHDDHKFIHSHTHLCGFSQGKIIVC